MDRWNAILKVIICAMGSLLSLHVEFAMGSDSAHQTEHDVLRTTLSRYLKDGNVGAARIGLLAINSRWPSYPPAIYDLALLDEADANWTDARKWLGEYLLTSADTGELDRARRELSRIATVEQREKSIGGHEGRIYDEHVMHAQILLDFGMPREALDQAAAAVAMDEKRWEGYAAAAESMSRVHRFPQAAEYLQAAINVATGEQRLSLRKALNTCRLEEQYQIQTHQAAIDMQGRHYASAARNYRAAWDAFPSRESTGIAVGLAYAMGGDYGTAAQVLTLLRSSVDPEVSRDARAILTRLELRRLIKPMETDADRDAAVAAQASAQGDLAAAQSAYEDAIDKEPANPVWHLRLAALQVRQRQWLTAEAEYRRAFLLDPSNLDSLSNLGAALMQQQNYGGAVGVYAIAIQRQPTNAIYHDHLGTALYFDQKIDAAVAEYERAVAIQPTDAAFQAHLIEARRAQAPSK